MVVNKKQFLGRRGVYLLVNNVRSAYNVGSLFRLCDAVRVEKLFLTGYTPYPKTAGDNRPAYVASRADRAIRKAGLAGVSSVPWEHHENPIKICQELKKQCVKIVSIEQSEVSQNYLSFLRSLKYTDGIKVCFVVVHERDGVDKELLAISDAVLDIPMKGEGKSLNVAMAATVVLFAFE